MIDDIDPDTFIREHTDLSAPALIPELRLHLATEVTPLWQATQDFLDDMDLPPPYWAFAWPGGQALARYLLDTPIEVRGKHVLAFAAGGGVDCLAAAKAGAAVVEANEIDPFATAAIEANAEANNLTTVRITERDIMGSVNPAWDVVIAGDVFYEQPMAGRALTWFKNLAAAGITVIFADPGRTYLPPQSMIESLADYDVPTSLDLEDKPIRRTVVYRFRG